MTQNVAQPWEAIVWIVGGAVVLFLFALAIALPQRSGVLPGSSGHRKEGEEAGHEEIRADGYIDSFAKEIEEAGGGLPPMVKLALPAVLLAWLLYLILNWTPR